MLERPAAMQLRREVQPVGGGWLFYFFAVAANLRKQNARKKALRRDAKSCLRLSRTRLRRSNSLGAFTIRDAASSQAFPQGSHPLLAFDRDSPA